MILVDSSVIIDLLGSDPVWGQRSTAAFRRAVTQDHVAIDDIVYAELAPGFGAAGDLDAVLDSFGLKTLPLTKAALFAAGHAYRAYRRRGGPKSSVLPDFFIGAHAAVEGASLLTRDPSHVARYFPTVALIAP